MSLIDLTVPRTREATVLGRISAVLAVAVPAFGRWLVRTIPRVRQLALYAGGLGALCVAAWHVGPVLGWASIGAALLLFEWLSTPSS